MTPAQALLLMQCRADVPDQQCYEAMAVLAEAVECARVVGVLDAWDESHPEREAFSTFHHAGASSFENAYVCASNYNEAGELAFYGTTRDAARAAAAKAIEAGGLG